MNKVLDHKNMEPGYYWAVPLDNVGRITSIIKIKGSVDRRISEGLVVLSICSKYVYSLDDYLKDYQTDFYGPIERPDGK